MRLVRGMLVALLMAACGQGPQDTSEMPYGLVDAAKCAWVASGNVLGEECTEPLLVVGVTDMRDWCQTRDSRVDACYFRGVIAYRHDLKPVSRRRVIAHELVHWLQSCSRYPRDEHHEQASTWCTTPDCTWGKAIEYDKLMHRDIRALYWRTKKEVL